MAYDEAGNYYDEPDSGAESPYEYTLRTQGPEAAAALLKAADEYYTNYAQGPGDPRPGLLKPGVSADKAVNWREPSSYYWLTNPPGKPAPAAAEEEKTAAASSTRRAAGGDSGYLDYYSWGGPMAPDLSWLRDAPAFEYAPFEAPAPFQAPGVEGMFADPGYQFRLDQGRRALEQSAAGRGTLRTGGTLKDLLGYGQNMASQEYGNVFGRARDTYQQNWNNALNAYTTNLGTAKDIYAPKLASWQNDQSARQNASNRAFERAWDTYAWAVPSANTIFSAGLT